MAHAALRIELNIDGKCKAVLVGTQRTQVIGQALGQHGQHAIGQVNRCRTMASLQIDMPVPRHIVRDIGNMNAQLVAALGRTLKRDGIVKVTRVNRIDRNDKPVAQIPTQRILERRCHIERKCLGLGKRSLGIAIGIAIARHHILNA